MPQPKLVTFDVYMALLDIEGSLVPVVMRALGLPTETATAFVRLWRAKQMERAAISNSLDKERTSFRDATMLGLAYVAGRNGVELTPQLREELVLAWDSLQPWPEANDVVAAIKAKGIATAILSNGDEDMLAAVARLFPVGFDHILSSETAGKYKPHPAVYALPTTELRIAKTDVVHVAGSANDVLGTVAAGMACIWSNRHGDRLLDPSYPPTHMVSSLRDVPDLI
ncbi:MAG: haloacid dehalogenase type II [Hyphomicrobiaceae bacterium]